MISCFNGKGGIVLINEEKKVAWWNKIFFSKIRIKEKNGYKIYTGHKSNFISKGGPTKFKIDMSKGNGSIIYHIGNGLYDRSGSKLKCEVSGQFIKDWYEENKKEFYKKN
jgi:hypothetical protein|tara:strand:- start:3 stop:332 length:330 start_codon:yes stop_codon:yes gene_type:complete